MSTRTVSPNKNAIRKLRIGKGWRVEDLAKEARCSERTIINIEKGKQCFVYTISRIADAFDVNVCDLMENELPPRRDLTNAHEVNILLDVSRQQFDETSDLVKLLEAIAKIVGDTDVEPKRIIPGSTQVFLDLTLPQLVKLLQAFQDGELNHFPILAISYQRLFFGIGDHRDFESYFKEHSFCEKQFKEKVRNYLAKQASENRKLP